MKSAALLVAFVAIGAGVFGVVSPESLLTVGRYVITPTGLYAVGAFRVAFGLLLILIAPSSRVPRTLRLVGAVVILAGFMTPIVGVEHSLAILEYGSLHLAMMRVGAIGAFAIGSFLVFALTPGRRVEAGAR